MYFNKLLFVCCLSYGLFSFSGTPDHLNVPLKQPHSTSTPWWSKMWDETSLGILFGGGLLVTGVQGPESFGDHSVRNQWQGHQRMSSDASKWGDLLGTGIPGALIASSQLYLDPEQGTNHWRALIGTTLMTYVLKESFHRARPGGSENHQSFPSGHTSTTFASATALSIAYGWKVGIVAYPLAIFTGLSRLADDAHWASDVVGGAVLGLWLGRALSASSSTSSSPSSPFSFSSSSSSSSRVSTTSYHTPSSPSSTGFNFWYPIFTPDINHQGYIFGGGWVGVF